MPRTKVERARAGWEAFPRGDLELFEDFTIEVEKCFGRSAEVVVFLRYRGRGRESDAHAER